MSRPFAAFDIDGTLIRWQLYHAIGDGMAKQGIIPASEFARVRKARMNWKRRSGEDSFRDYETALIKVFDAALEDLAVDDLKQIVGRVFDEYKDQVYMYTRDLIEALRAKNYLLFAVSGSPTLIVELLAQFYGFDASAGTDYPAVDGRFTGEKLLSLGHKDELLRGLVEQHGATFSDSIAVGDSEGDIGMLALVEQPIAFNPSKGLFAHAQAQHWRVVLERKNMIYQLEPQNGSYILAQTNS